ncbi:MAG: NAD(P)/FAD-dependent oxidoreductase [Sphingomonadales bacterium]
MSVQQPGRNYAAGPANLSQGSGLPILWRSQSSLQDNICDGLNSPISVPAGAYGKATDGDRTMRYQIIIIGAGFAGMYAALSSARLRDTQGVPAEDMRIALVSPEPTLVVRPRLYEPHPETLTAPLGAVLKAIDVDYLQGRATGVDTAARTVEVIQPDGRPRTHAYDRLVITTGSELFRPDIPGLSDHAHSIDTLHDAIAFDRHLGSLAGQAPSDIRDTAVVVGGGFTGIEVATELPARMRAVLGPNAAVRVVIVERNPAVAPDMGPGPRPIIAKALAELAIETRLGVGVTSLDKDGVTLSDKSRIASATVVWAAGMRAAPLTALIPAERDNFGRLVVDRHLRVPGVAGVFAAGDAAKAVCDNDGNLALMSCQHATRLGAFAGNNAAAELLGLPPMTYHQEAYVTCLDLGAAGAVFTRGWGRNVEMVGAEAKQTKREINTVWIYPPPADRAVALASADPERVTSL